MRSFRREKLVFGINCFLEHEEVQDQEDEGCVCTIDSVLMDLFLLFIVDERGDDVVECCW